MKVGMMFPDRNSEKAISGYSCTLTENMRKTGIPIEDVTYFAGKPWSIIKKIWKIKKFDVIHIQHEYNLLGWYGIPFFILYFILLFSKIKVVTTMHTALSMKENFNGNKLKTILRKILYFTQNRMIKWISSKTVVHANFFKEILCKEYGFNKKDILVFPQAIIENVKITPKNKAKRELNLSGPVYLFMGEIVPDHGQDIIIKQTKNIGPTILVVGSPFSVNDRNSSRVKSYLKENQDYVKEENLDKIVRFDIFKMDDKKQEWWNYFCAADLVLLPYRGGIGSGIFAHAMATETPVVASNIKFFNEISKKFGCLKITKKESDYPKVIKESMKPKNLKRMIKECKRYKKIFGLTPFSKKYKRLYEKL